MTKMIIEVEWYEGDTTGLTQKEVEAQAEREAKEKLHREPSAFKVLKVYETGFSDKGGK